MTHPPVGETWYDPGQELWVRYLAHRPGDYPHVHLLGTRRTPPPDAGPVAWSAVSVDGAELAASWAARGPR